MSNRPTELPARPNPEKTSRLPSMPALTQRANALHTEELQTMIMEMQRNFQQQLQQQQRDFEIRVEQLMIGKSKMPETSPPNINKTSSFTPSGVDIDQGIPSVPVEDQMDIGIASNDPINNHGRVPRSPQAHDSRYVGQPAYPSAHNHAYPIPPLQNSHTTKLKASDLPKFKGDKGEDVETWIEQVDAIFESTKCSESDIVALLSVILKGTALRWFTRLGPRRALYTTWNHWQGALRERFLEANYLAEKKRQWKKRDLRPNEAMVDYFDAKVDLQAYVFDETTPESELILDILDGLPDHMLPTLKSSITVDTDLLKFRRILLDYEKGLRWSGPWASRRSDGNSNRGSPGLGGDRNGPSTNTKPVNRDPSKPPKPCSCGGMHWYRDCQKKDNQVQQRLVLPSNFGSQQDTDLEGQMA